MTLQLTALTTILIVAFAECKVRTNDIYRPFFLVAYLEISLCVLIDAPSPY